MGKGSYRLLLHIECGITIKKNSSVKASLALRGKAEGSNSCLIQIDC